MQTTFPERLKELRLEAKMNQRTLAAKAHVSQGTVCHWENGNRQPDLDTLMELCKIFNVTADYLLGLSDNT